MIKSLKYIKSKKGVSEMVSYVLLVVIALGLAGGIYSWMSIHATEDKEEKCADDVAIMIKEYSCDDVNKIISLKVENKGYFNMDGFFIKGAKELDTLPAILLRTNELSQDLVVDGRYDFQTPFGPGEVAVANFSYTNAIPLKTIRIQPFVLGVNNIQLCENKVTTEISGCN